jgi:hypothetical protein
MLARMPVDGHHGGVFYDPARVSGRGGPPGGVTATKDANFIADDAIADDDGKAVISSRRPVPATRLPRCEKCSRLPLAASRPSANRVAARGLKSLRYSVARAISRNASGDQMTRMFRRWAVEPSRPSPASAAIPGRVRAERRGRLRSRPRPHRPGELPRLVPGETENRIGVGLGHGGHLPVNL